ncbi:class I SAM-dependent methyltransferase [Streptomyces sp. NPDC058783]|uniref:class I SAM-dependent methyltransferase n=1 Tax=Streptomyces sp. NPDC058783 TaxID=3346633 RepID=UPI0036834B54
MTSTTGDPAELRGDADMYTKPVLMIYDPIALGMVCPVAWRCSRRTMLSFYNDSVRGNHLDIGPGSGFFLDKCRFPARTPRITLLDLNELVLRTAARRIARYRPTTVVRDVLGDLDLGERKFESVALQNVLHCLPGTMKQKGVVFDNVRPYVADGGVVFGCTVLGKQPPLPAHGRWMMEKYNQAGSFRNTEDGVEELEAQLAARFTRYSVRTRGAVAFFEGHC